MDLLLPQTGRIAKAESEVQIVGVFAEHAVQAAFQRIVRRSKWTVETVTTWEDALAVMQGPQVGVIVTERYLNGGLCWIDLLNVASARIPQPRLIVTDRLADDALWAKVLNLGGHDVIAQPFDAGEVLRTLSFAYDSWRSQAATTMLRGNRAVSLR